MSYFKNFSAPNVTLPSISVFSSIPLSLLSHFISLKAIPTTQILPLCSVRACQILRYVLNFHSKSFFSGQNPLKEYTSLTSVSQKRSVYYARNHGSSALSFRDVNGADLNALKYLPYLDDDSDPFIRYTVKP